MPSQILSADAPQRVVKYPEEGFGVAMEFAKLLVPASQTNPAETIASITSITFEPTGPTVVGQAIVGSQVQFKVSGGIAGVNYRAIVLVHTSLGYDREGKGPLIVVN